jgi:hypothetical protein
MSTWGQCTRTAPPRGHGQHVARHDEGIELVGHGADVVVHVVRAADAHVHAAPGRVQRVGAAL